MSDKNEIKKDNHIQAYELAEQFCMEKYPGIKPCMDLTNDTADMKKCKELLNVFRDCFTNQKQAIYKHLGRTS